IPGEGHAILRDAIEHDDMMVRRAAVFGLAKLQTMWAIDEMYRIMREDSQWYVRSAAESIFTFVQDPEEKGLKPFPAVDTLTWLNQWASSQQIPEDATLAQVVLHAFRTGQTQVRVLAAHALTYLDPSDVVKPLYGALSDRDEAVRAAAHQALTEIHLRATRPLPGIA
ncbi:MAG: HEAT repeat domain-containing protein, partial [Chloroflexi bacterium]|nr:HEAT repeat domain-containing protein [Chloroflexota bacterium]